MQSGGPQKCVLSLRKLWIEKVLLILLPYQDWKRESATLSLSQPPTVLVVERVLQYLLLPMKQVRKEVANTFSSAGASYIHQSSVIFSTVPSGAPNGVEEVSTASNSITVRWEEVDCLLRNGIITGYTAQAVRNGVVEGTASVGGDARQATISELESSTEYSVQVAAVNSAGTGPFSSPITVMTSGE